MGWDEGVILSFSIYSPLLATHLILSTLAVLRHQGGSEKLTSRRTSSNSRWECAMSRYEYTRSRHKVGCSTHSELDL